MVREPNIPLFLWIATAILVHLTWGGGAEKVSDFVQEQMDVRRFALSVSSGVRKAQGTIDVTFETFEEPVPEQPPPDEPLVPELPLAQDPTAPDKSEQPEAEKPKQPEPAAKPEPKKPPQEKNVEVTPAAPEAPKKVEPPSAANRIAVQQVVKDQKQAPNPTAELIGEHDNHVLEQTQARITSTEQNDPEPEPGGQHSGPSPDPGDSHVTDIAQLEDRQGSMSRAPGNPLDGQKEVSAAAAAAAAGSKQAQSKQSQGEPESAERRAQEQAQQKLPLDPGQQQRAESVASSENPDVNQSQGGLFRMAETTPEQRAQQQQALRRRRLPPLSGAKSPNSLLGLGASGSTPNGINLNLTHSAALATVGEAQLSRQLLADGERRRSKHRGSWHTTGLERWRSAIENYVPQVKPGNQTALNTASVPFAIYLNKIHLRLHPIFADEFLAHLEGLPSNHPLNRMDMRTNLEIILSGTDGTVVGRGVTKASGVTAFDIGALESVERAAPFGTPPSAIVSPDGRVYLHWEFWRNPQYACSTFFARPIMLRADPKSAPIESPTPPPFREPEEPVPGQNRQGTLIPGSSPLPQQRLASTP